MFPRFFVVSIFYNVVLKYKITFNLNIGAREDRDNKGQINVDVI